MQDVRVIILLTASFSFQSGLTDNAAHFMKPNNCTTRLKRCTGKRIDDFITSTDTANCYDEGIPAMPLRVSCVKKPESATKRDRAFYIKGEAE
ncbi:hypothetical protein [Fischerella sp. PCC 9605]|uniref:hypothetical protein n=1 Tax=Fischerella sp. PCC 9605 TaxID=1173024 RepID=UPI0004AC7A12|nr:hypothetical protein [Fischerella sp. PCC 9605]